MKRLTVLNIHNQHWIFYLQYIEERKQISKLFIKSLHQPKSDDMMKFLNKSTSKLCRWREISMTCIVGYSTMRNIGMSAKKRQIKIGWPVTSQIKGEHSNLCGWREISMQWMSFPYCNIKFLKISEQFFLRFQETFSYRLSMFWLHLHLLHFHHLALLTCWQRTGEFSQRSGRDSISRHSSRSPSDHHPGREELICTHDHRCICWGGKYHR